KRLLERVEVLECGDADDVHAGGGVAAREHERRNGRETLEVAALEKCQSPVVPFGRRGQAAINAAQPLIDNGPGFVAVSAVAGLLVSGLGQRGGVQRQAAEEVVTRADRPGAGAEDGGGRDQAASPPADSGRAP